MENQSKSTVNTIKIGLKNYTIDKPTEIEEVAGEYYGTASVKKNTIRVANKFEQHDKNLTFVHEMIHCICHRFDLRDLNEDEHSIEMLSLGIYEAICDNPLIFTMADI